MTGTASDVAPAPALDVRGWPTPAVFALIVAALVDLLLLLPRVVASLFCARRWRARTERLIYSEALHAPQDPHPAR